MFEYGNLPKGFHCMYGTKVNSQYECWLQMPNFCIWLCNINYAFTQWSEESIDTELYF
jgi:hypothetical protein